MYESLLPRIKALPGVISVATVNVVPFTGATGGWDGPFVADGADGQSSPALVFSFAVVGAEYFETVGIRLRSGRTFDRNDRRGGAPVAIVSEQAARLLGVEGEPSGGEYVSAVRLESGGPLSAWQRKRGIARSVKPLRPYTCPSSSSPKS
jgi:putative ABC transport system permease protein